MSQDSLFDLGGLTVTSNEERIRAEQIAAGDTVEGRRKIFESRTIRTIRLAYGIEEAREMVEWIKSLMSETHTKNASEAMLAFKRRHAARKS